MQEIAISSKSLTQPDSLWFDVIPALGISSIDHLYNRLDGKYPGKWRAQFPDPQSIQNWRESWVEAFEDEKLTFEEVIVGLRECRKLYTWPPSDGEFIRACRPGLDPLAAYHEAVAGLAARERGDAGNWTSLAIYWAAASMAYDLKMQSYGQIKDRWQVALAAQMAKGQWEPIKEPDPQLGYTPSAPSPAAADITRQMQAAWKREDAAFDHLRWAKRTFERLQAGDKSIPLYTIKAAADALGCEVPA